LGKSHPFGTEKKEGGEIVFLEKSILAFPLTAKPASFGPPATSHATLSMGEQISIAHMETPMATQNSLPTHRG